ncbi:MAG: phosphatidylglycerophosphatase A [Deltaproteobacteria bacterium]|jgi:phosphatidylglycerophosphatase A|nr:phosphatidylglycerophosphatase A [Deltaproteobacteria bacterium]
MNFKLREIKKLPGFKNFLIRQFYTCFGLGLAPVASGTFGTLLGIPLYFLFRRFGLPIYILATLAVFFSGWWACNRAETDLGTHDDHRVVIDEVLGYLVTMTSSIPPEKQLPFAWVWGFFLFRLFDIWKPGPAGWVDRNTPGGLGVMLDDAVAGVFALVTMYVLTLIWHGFFVT